jgi:hypothetical protein
MKFFFLFALVLTFNVSAKSIKFMAYNAENIFDTKHDENTDDYTYLPLEVKNGIHGFHEI